MTIRSLRHDASGPNSLSASFFGALLALAISVSSARAGYDLAPWATNTHPSDMAKTHVENATEGSHKYTVNQGGTMDGENCRTPLSVGMDGTNNAPMEKTWESNRSVRMENIGTADVVNPWLSNGRNNFRNTPKSGGAVKVSVSLERSTQQVDVNALSWGQEKLLIASTAVLGPCVQEYVLNLGN
jgi:hypothetical protein